MHFLATYLQFRQQFIRARHKDGELIAKLCFAGEGFHRIATVTASFRFIGTNCRRPDTCFKAKFSLGHYLQTLSRSRNEYQIAKTPAQMSPTALSR